MTVKNECEAIEGPREIALVGSRDLVKRCTIGHQPTSFDVRSVVFFNQRNVTHSQLHEPWILWKLFVVIKGLQTRDSEETAHGDRSG